MPISKQNAPVMSNEEYAAIVDEFSEAVAGLLPHAPRESLMRLSRATGNLLETLASRSAMQSAGAFTAVYAELKRELAQANRRIDRKQTKTAGLQSVVEDLRDRVAILERAVGAQNGG